MFFCRQLHVLLLSIVAAAAAVAVLSIGVDAVRMRLLWLSIIPILYRFLNFTRHLTRRDLLPVHVHALQLGSPN